MASIKNVFISHHSKDEEHITGIRSLLADNGISLKNSSIDSSKPNNATSPEYIKGILRDRISWAGAFLVIIGPETHSREWVNWEIEEAHRQGKIIVGVYVNGGGEVNIPDALEKYADAVVGWRAKNLIAALEGKYRNWETPEGEPRESPWTIDRSSC